MYIVGHIINYYLINCKINSNKYKNTLYFQLLRVNLVSNSIYFCIILFSNSRTCFSNLISKAFCIASTVVSSLATFCYILVFQLISSSFLYPLSFYINGITLSWIYFIRFSIYCFFRSFYYLWFIAICPIWWW